MQMLLGGVCSETPEDSCPHQSVYARPWRTTVGWAATNLHNTSLRQALCLNIPLFPFQFAFVSLSLHLDLEANADPLFRDAETPPLTRSSTSSMVSQHFYSLGFKSADTSGKNTFSESFKKTR